MEAHDIVIPLELRPGDGRFGSGPSKVPVESVAALGDRGRDLLGTSHRQAPVRELVNELRRSVSELFALPDGFEVVLGVGGATVFWDVAVFSLIEKRSQHLVFGEFSSKFASAAAAAPHLSEPEIISSEPGTHPLPQASDADGYALTHNETSTGVAMEIARVAPRAFTLVDGTSAAGGMLVDPADFDVYYFSPQKAFASEGGLWIALCSPAAVQRVDAISSSERYIPPSLDLKLALENSRADQTYNTPAIATIFLMARQVDWMLSNGGLEWSAGRSASSARILYEWAERSEFAEPFVKDPTQRSPVVGTIDLAASIDAPTVTGILRTNGIVDTEPYRKLGRNQLRVAMYPAIDPEDVELLTRCIDYVVERLG